MNEFKKQSKGSSVTILPHRHLYRTQSHLQSHYTHNLVAGRHPQNQNIVILPHLQKQLGKRKKMAELLEVNHGLQDVLKNYFKTMSEVLREKSQTRDLAVLTV